MTELYFLDSKFKIPVDIVAYRPKNFQITSLLVYEIMEYGKEIKLK
ncbi:MAG: hypothetical protein Q7T79_03450 [bacterium]|nr:hypothetical protein [bacterium]